MQATCSRCNKEFNDKVGMSPLQSNMAIRVRNKVGNICPECRAEICKTKKGRWKMWFYDLEGRIHLPAIAVADIPAVCGLDGGTRFVRPVRVPCIINKFVKLYIWTR